MHGNAGKTPAWHRGCIPLKHHSAASAPSPHLRDVREHEAEAEHARHNVPRQLVNVPEHTAADSQARIRCGQEHGNNGMWRWQEAEAEMQVWEDLAAGGRKVGRHGQ